MIALDDPLLLLIAFIAVLWFWLAWPGRKRMR